MTLRGNEQIGEEEGNYYYYYYYDDSEANKETNVPSATRSNKPSSSPSETRDFFYYYYYDYENESNESESKLETSQSKNNEVVDTATEASKNELSPLPSTKPSNSGEYYYYYYEENDTSHPSQTPSEEDNDYYYYEENDTSHPSQTPSEEEYYYYYYDEESKVSSQPPQVSSNPTSSLQKEDEEVYYYYYVQEESSSDPSSHLAKQNIATDDSTHPSISPPITNNEGRKSDIPTSTSDLSTTKYDDFANGRGCHDSIMSTSSEGITANELSFSFMAETNDRFQTWDEVPTKIIEKVSPSILRCTSEKIIRSTVNGIFLIHFPIKEPFVQENRCIPVINDMNDCFIFSGRILLASNRMITEKESDHAYLAIQGAINSLDTLTGDIAFAKYLGPTTQLENNSHGLWDQIIVAISVVLSIPLIFLVYRFQRKLSKGYKRVTYDNQTNES